MASPKVFGVNLQFGLVSGKKTVEKLKEKNELLFMGTEDDCRDWVKNNKPKDLDYDYDSSSEHEEKGEQNDGKNEPVEKDIAKIFDTTSQNEKPPIPHVKHRNRVVGTVKPEQRGGWYLFIDPTTSQKSVVTKTAAERIIKEKKFLRFLGECDEKGDLKNGKV